MRGHLSLATLAVSAVARLTFTTAASLSDYTVEVVSIIVGGVAAAWVGAGLLERIPKHRVLSVIALLLIAIAALLVFETYYVGSTALALPHDVLVRGPIAIISGLVVGAVSSLLGVAGGELIIPILMFCLWSGQPGCPQALHINRRSSSMRKTSA
jgi:uncharacterized protein